MILFYVVLALIVLLIANRYFFGGKSSAIKSQLTNEVLKRVFTELELFVKTTQQVPGPTGTPVKKVVTNYPKLTSITEDGFIIRYPQAVQASKIDASLKGFASKLYEMQLIPSPFLLSYQSGIFNQIRYKYSSEQEYRMNDLLVAAGLSRTNSSGEVVRPEFSIDDKNNIRISAKQFPISLDQIKKAVPIFNSLNSSVIYKEGNIKFDEGYYYIKAINKAAPLIANGKSLGDVFNEYKQRMSSYSEDCWIIGENSETGQFDSLPCIEKPVLLIAGGTGSGKTVLAKSIVFNRLINNPSTQLIIFDGKASADWTPFCNLASDYKLGVPRNDYQNNLVEFSNILNIVWAEFLRRQSVLQESKSSNYSEHNKKSADKINPMLIVWEEAPVIFSFLDFKEDSQVINSDSWKFLRLIREMRSYGINFVLCTQTVTQDSVPAAVLKQSIYIVGKSNQQTANYLKCDDIVSLEREFILFDGANQSREKALFLGNDSQVEALLKALNKQVNKKEFDYTLVSYRGNEQEKNDLHALARGSMFKNYKVVAWEDDAKTHDLCGRVINPKSESISIYFVEKDELNQKLINDIKTDDAYLLFILMWELKDKDISDLDSKCKNGVYPHNSIFMSSTRWQKLLGRAFSKIGQEDTFEEAVLRLERDRVVALGQLLSDEASTQSDQTAKQAVPIANGKISTTEWDYNTEVAAVELSYQSLLKIVNLSGKTAAQSRVKGMKLEAFLAKYFQAINPNCEILAGNKLKASELVVSKSADGDGGVDVVIKHEDNSLTLIQSKNYADSYIDVDKVRLFSFARNYSESKGHTVRELVYITASRFSGDAREAGKACGMRLIDGEELKKMIGDLQIKQSNEQQAQERPKKRGRPKLSM